MGHNLLALQPVPDPLAVQRVGVDDERAEPLLDHRCHGGRILAVMGLAEADRAALVGDPYQHDVALGVGAEAQTHPVALERA